MGYDFETDKKYNSEKNVSMTIELNKTCFSKGEFIIGKIILKPKDGLLTQTQLINPYGLLSLNEKHYYEYYESYYDESKKAHNLRKREEIENVPLLSVQLDFSNFSGANILVGIQIPFQIKVPETAYPSCVFENNEYVKHFLTIEIPSIEAKKTEVIIIKNNIYFSNFNGLLKAPCNYHLQTTKYKYLFFNYGSFNSTITLSKNIFTYDEVIPFMVDIECTNLSIPLKNINATLYRRTKKNYSYDHSRNRKENTVQIINKVIPLKTGETIYHIEDLIQIPKTIEINPKQVYNTLDIDKRKYNEKFKNIKLFPTCYGGLLTCEYYLKITYAMDSWFTSNEEVKIPLDFYEPFTINNFTNTQPFTQNDYMNTNNYLNTKQITNIQQNQLTETEKPSSETNNQEDELPNEEEVNMQNNNNNNKDDEFDKDGSAPPPNFFMPNNNK